MTIRVNGWYRVKETNQYCRVQRIPSKTSPQVHVQTANENTRGFELAVEWFSALDGNLEKWAKRVMILELEKAFGLFREPSADDWPTIDKVKSVAFKLPVWSAGRDGEFTIPL